MQKKIKVFISLLFRQGPENTMSCICNFAKNNGLFKGCPCMGKEQECGGNGVHGLIHV
jgi:hypothetical protein